MVKGKCFVKPGLGVPQSWGCRGSREELQEAVYNLQSFQSPRQATFLLGGQESVDGDPEG